MATKLINTRIKNKIDDLSAWLDDGITLLKGEIAVAQVPTSNTYENPITGATEPVIELLMKVGNGTSSFGELPWLSAKAADVYDWAKVRDPSTITVKYNSGTTEKPNWVSSTLANVLEDLKTTMADTAEKLDDITVNVPSDASGVVKSIAKDTDAKGTINVTMGKVAAADIAKDAVTADAIKNGEVTNDKLGEDISANKIIYSGSTANNDQKTVAYELQRLNSELLGVREKFSVDPTSVTANAVVQGITYNSSTGKFTVTYGTVAAGDIASNAVTTVKIKNANVTEAKIATDAVTTDKIKDKNVTDAKIDTVSASKVEITPKTTVNGEEVPAVMLPEKLSMINSEISRVEGNLNTFIASGVRFIGKAKAAPSASSNDVTIDDGTTSGKIVTAQIGDVVIYNTIEYICVAKSGSARWQELGDQSRLGVLETLTGSLQADARTANKYVTHIIKSAGKLKVQYAQPTAAEILCVAGSDETLDTKIGAFNDFMSTAGPKLNDVESSVGASITAAINNLDYSSPSASGTTTAFIDSISQTNGVISATKKTITSATTKAAGIVKLDNTITSESTSTAGTANSVRLAAEKGADAQSRVADIEADYMRVDADDNRMYLGKDGTDYIIFDCGGATV